MLIKLQNCNNIDEGEINIELNKLNIKYAINGTGKSTIVKAIDAFCHNDIQKKQQLVPFKYRKDKEDCEVKLEGLEDIKTISVFNEEYINNYLFLKDDLLKGTFDIFIKSPEYDKHLETIELLLLGVRETFRQHEELDELIDVFNLFVSGCGRNASNISKSSAIVKALKDGNKLSNIPKELEAYKQYLTDEKNNVQWLKWQMDGLHYLNDTDKCPYCTASIKNTRQTILKVKDEFDAKAIEHLNDMLRVFNSMSEYFSEATKTQVENITNNINGITEENKNFLFSIKQEASRLLSGLLKLKTIGFTSLESEKQIDAALNEYKIDVKNFQHFNSKLTNEKAVLINKTLDAVLEEAKQLGIEINKQKSHIKKTVSKYNNEINEFLQCAGYDYSVSIEGERDVENYHLRLKHNKCKDNIDNVDNYLSYGERNAFALVLFMYSAIKDNPDLIVLDDPISSFDGNKKFAILNMLFGKTGSLRDKTVLLLTHEFSTVIDSLKNITGLDRRLSVAFLYNKKGELAEKVISKDDIKSFIELSTVNIDSKKDNLNKLIYLRRLLEVTKCGSCAYEMISSLFHNREYPSRKVSREEFEPLLEEEINQANDEIKEYISDFDYSIEYGKIQDEEKMKDIYRHAESDYERLQLYRIKYNYNSNNPVIRKYINETFHVENDYLFQLNPCEYDTVPYFVIVECNRAMLGTDEVEMEE